MSLWSWVRALTEAKEKGIGHAPIACEWDHPSSEWARVSPKPGGPLTTRQLAEYKWMSGYPTPLQKIGQSLLSTWSSTKIQNIYTPAFTCPKQSNICNISNTATWAHKLILIKTDITTILQLSPNSSIVDCTFIQTYINIYKSNTCYVQKPSKL